MIRAIIVDDEQHCIERLLELLSQYCKYIVTIAGCFSTVDEALEGIKKCEPELVFLDVEINDHTGFELLQKIGKINFDVIFTTAHNQYAVQAFKFSAIDYLLKPVDPDDLMRAVEKCKEKIQQNSLASRFETLFHNIKNTDKGQKKINVATVNGFEILNVKDIIRCKSDVNYTTLYLTNRKPFMVAKTLKEFDEMLSGQNFFRVHNSHLVNLDYVKAYHKGKGGYITLTDGQEIEVSTRRKDDLMKALSNL